MVLLRVRIDIHHLSRRFSSPIKAFGATLSDVGSLHARTHHFGTGLPEAMTDWPLLITF